MSKVIFGDVVRRANTKEDRYNTDKIYYVGGEHIGSNEVLIENRGLIEGSTIGPMFYFGFKAGDVLFVSRNPHLRKAGMVTFDGICSEKTFVLETKDETILLQKFLPFVMQSDHFWNYMETHKSGSVNFFINWSTLAQYEFELPDIQTQERLSNILWAINDSKNANRKLILKTDAVIKSQFNRMFYDGDYPSVKIGEVIKQHTDIEKVQNPHIEKYVTVALYGKGVREREGVYDPKPFSGYRVNQGQFIYSRIDARNGAFGIIPSDLQNAVVSKDFPVFDICSEKILPSFLLFTVLDDNFINQIKKNSHGTTNRQRIKEEVFLDYSLVLPPLNEQFGFETMYRQGEVVKQELNTAIDNLITLERSILAENFN